MRQVSSTQFIPDCTPLSHHAWGSPIGRANGKTPCTQSQWDEASAQSQLKSLPQATKEKQNQDQSSMWVFPPHATPTKTQTKVAWVPLMLHHQHSVQTKQMNEKDDKMDKMDVEQNGGQDGCEMRWWTNKQNPTEQTEPNQLNQTKKPSAHWPKRSGICHNNLKPNCT